MENTMIGNPAKKILLDQWRRALATAAGDSNDEEIQAWHDLAETALLELGLTEPVVED